MKKNKLISTIVVYVDNDKNYLPKCLTSIEVSARHAGIPLEFILIANVTGKVKTEYLTSPVKILTNKINLGLAGAVNQAVKKARWEWCLFSCPDVITDKNCLKTLKKSIKDKNISLLGPKIILPDGAVQTSILSIPALKNIFLEQSFLYKLFPSLFFSPLANKSLYQKPGYQRALAAIWWLFDKNAFIKTGGLDEQFFLYFEDVDLCNRITAVGGKIFFDPNASVRHLPHKSTGGYTSGKNYFQSLKKYLLKYNPKFYADIALLIFLTGCLCRLIFWSLIIKFMDNKNL